ncbi:metallophosphoesterase family protein [Phreatobacter aquaticus]|uniref:Metallophosphoesterase family protein n=1 Tax=Phreatobacter aquaticus TaxID=2570229 RepID=A0A4D7QM91_9HYPH|nr:metallophosphoesterase family protein [Phreatobacter aquaticus]QCK86546.1 metallophosphoesterase family protein [Phreatobacter aquaticus]
MRLAVIADIHGNVLALDAVLADIAARDLTRIVNLGDCVSGPLWPRETAERLMALDLPTVRGNHDRWVATEDPEKMYFSDRFALDELPAEAIAWLGGLPTMLDLDLAGVGIRAFHATPADDNRYLMEDATGGRLVQAGAESMRHRLGDPGSARLALCGHSHLARLIELETPAVTLLNPGSVGCPAYSDPTPPEPHVSEVGSPHARYAIVSAADGALTSIDMVAVPYDWKAAAARAAELGRQDWARGLTSGFAK